MRTTLIILFLISFVSAKGLRVDGHDFLKGLLDGVGEKTAPDKLYTCLKNMPAIMTSIHQGLVQMEVMKQAQLTVGVKAVFTAAKDLLTLLEPCDSSGYETLKKLDTLLTNYDLKKTVSTILNRTSEYAYVVREALGGFENKQYVVAGRNVGVILKMIFFS